MPARLPSSFRSHHRNRSHSRWSQHHPTTKKIQKKKTESPRGAAVCGSTPQDSLCRVAPVAPRPASIQFAMLLNPEDCTTTHYQPLSLSCARTLNLSHSTIPHTTTFVFILEEALFRPKRLKLEVQLRPSSCCFWLRSASTSFTAFAFSNPPPPRPYCLGTGETSIVAVGDHLSCQAVIVLWANKRTCVR